MRRTVVGLLAAVICRLPALGSDQTVRVAGPVPGSGFIGDHPAVTATADGFAVAWRDVELGGPYGLVGRMRLALYDLDGRRTADSGPMDFDIDQTSFYLHALVLDRGGFLSFMADDAAAVWTLRIGADGGQLGPAQRAVAADEIELMSVASNNGKILLTTPEWEGTWTDWATPIGDDGLPSGPRVNVAPAILGEDPISRFLDDSPIAPIAGGFVTTWFEGGVGIRLRELSNRGVPSGSAILVDGTPCVGLPAIATVQEIEAVVYPRGCDQTDLYLRTRDRHGSLSDSIALSSDPRNEGSVHGSEFARALRVAGGDDRIGVLYSLATPHDGGPETCDWIFAEFDLRGDLIGSRRSLSTDFGIFPDHDVDLGWDPYHHRYLLAWAGEGPQGPGVYVDAVTPSR